MKHAIFFSLLGILDYEMFMYTLNKKCKINIHIFHVFLSLISKYDWLKKTLLYKPWHLLVIACNTSKALA